VPEHGTPITIGVVSISPRGSRHSDGNDDLMVELEERVSMYRLSSMVILAGDFNAHIADTPSILTRTSHSLLGVVGDVEGNDDEDSDGAEEYILTRRSADSCETSLSCESGMSGVDFVQRMNALGMVVLNGLEEVGDGSKAEATFGDSSIIDYILIDADHWQYMGSVKVEYIAADRVQSDHQLIVSEARLPSVPTASSDSIEAAVTQDDVSFLLRHHRFRTLTQGDGHYWDAFRQKCDELLPSLCDRLISLTDKEDGSHSNTTSLKVESAWA